MLVNNHTSMRMGIEGGLDDLMEEHFTLLLKISSTQYKENGVTGNTIN